MPGPGRPRRGGREGDRGGNRDAGFPAGFQAVQERFQHLLVPGEAVAPGAAPGEVTRDSRAQAGVTSACFSGQGRAIERRAVISDLA